MAATTYELLAFGLFAALTLGSSIGVVLVRDVWHAALLLGVALLSVAVHYVMLQAEFIAAMQVLVYVGGVLILISFAVMLVRRQVDPSVETRPEFPLGSNLIRGAGAVALFAVLVAVLLRTPFGEAAGFSEGADITASIGYAMFDLPGGDISSEGFLVAFILIAVVLDAAIEGAIMLARRDAGGRLVGALRSDGGDRE